MPGAYRKVAAYYVFMAEDLSRRADRQRTLFRFAMLTPRGGGRMGRRGRQLAEKHDDPARRAVISEWDRWALRRLPTGYKATGDDEMRFFGHMQKDCPHLLPDDKDDPWQAVHGWLLLERRVRDQLGTTAPMRRRRIRQYFTGPLGDNA
jgi:hypothetical protein